jgi:hypothetical protein
MTVSSVGVSGIPVSYSQPLPPPQPPPSARGESTAPDADKKYTSFSPSAKDAEYGKRFVIAPEDRTNENAEQGPAKQNTTPSQQLGRQIGRLVDRVV